MIDQPGDDVIDDVQVYSQALSAEDVTLLFNNPGSALGGIGAAVPAPNAFVLAALGLLALGMTRRRRRR